MNERIRELNHRIGLIYEDPVDLQRAIGISALNLILVIGGVAVLLVMLLLDITLMPDLIFPIFVMIGVAIFNQYMIFNHALPVASLIVTAQLIVLALFFNWQRIDTQFVLLWVLPVVVAASLLDRRSMGLVAFVSILGVVIGLLGQTQLTAGQVIIPASTAFTDFALVIMVLVLVGVVLMLVSNGLVQRIAHSRNTLQRIDQIQELEERLNKSVDERDLVVAVSWFVVEQLNYQTTQLNLYDPNGNLGVYVRAGMGTRHSVNRGEFTDSEAILQAISNRDTVVVSLLDPVKSRRHFMPSTRHAAAVPILNGDELIGILDVQSSAADSPFTRDELTLLHLVAVSFAKSFVYIRMVSTFQKALSEITMAQESTQQGEAFKRVDSAGSWRDFLNARGQSASFGFDLRQENMAVVPASNLPDELRPALESGELVVRQMHNQQVVNVPILVRGEVLGAMAFTIATNRTISERQLDMARVVAQRLSMALETARLTEETAALAEREHKSAEVANTLLGHQQIDNLLLTAAESFNEAMGAVYTRIYIDPDAIALKAENEETL
jgi:GAF domain-containing protein